MTNGQVRNPDPSQCLVIALDLARKRMTLNASEPSACAPDQLMMRPDPGWDSIERRAIEFLIIAIDNPDCTILAPELRHHHGEFARKLLGSIGGNIQAFQDEATLVFAFLANHEIKRVVRHPKVPPLRFASHDTTESGSSVSATHREQSPLSPHVAFRQTE